MNLRKKAWLALAFVATLPGLPTASAVDGGESGATYVSATTDLRFECKGTASTTTVQVATSGSLLEIGPVKILHMEARVAVQRTYWKYTCTTTQTLRALGWGGILQDVSVSQGRPDGSRSTYAVCSYQGVADVPVTEKYGLRNQCTASFTMAQRVVDYDSGVAEQGHDYPDEMKACIDAPIYGDSEGTLGGAYDVLPKDGYCEQVAIGYDASSSAEQDVQKAVLTLLPAV